MNVFATVELARGASHADSGLIAFGLVTGFVAVALFIRMTRRLLSAPPGLV